MAALIALSPELAGWGLVMSLRKPPGKQASVCGGFAGVGVGLVGLGGVDLNSAELAPQYLGGASPLECGEESVP